MELCRRICPWIVFAVTALSLSLTGLGQSSSGSSSSSAGQKGTKKPAAPPESSFDAGAVTNGVYRNKTLGLSLKIPEAWVLRTDEINAREGGSSERRSDEKSAEPGTAPPASSIGAKVLLAAFSRPPEAKAEDVNSSVLIAAENASAYPGLKEAAQYFYPLIEVAKEQGFTLDEEPYEIAVGTKNLVRADFHKDVGSRVMRQSTLAMLSHGYAVSITVIAGTDDEVEDLIDGLSFSGSGK